jgi:lysophospholipase L1-like esterase
VIADGLGGESTGEGKNRLKIDLPFFNPDVLLLMEGTNDMLGVPGSPEISSAADALENMVRQGKSRGVRVLVATLLPIDPVRVGPASADSVNILNGRIRTMAAAENVTLVDLNAVIPLSLISPDGKHPIPSAYQVIADEWLKAIEATIEIKIP